jgi:hypothetical protein
MGFLAILSAVWNVICKVIAAIPWQVWVLLVAFLFGGWVFHGGSCKDFACHRTPRPPRPPRIHKTVGAVLSVESANSMTITVSGPLGRRKWPLQVTVADVVVPVEDTAGKALAASLCPVGSIVTVQTESSHLFGADPLDDETYGARGPLVGEVTAASGQDVGLELITAGWADAGQDASAAYLAARNKARNAKIGMWSKKRQEASDD